MKYIQHFTTVFGSFLLSLCFFPVAAQQIALVSDLKNKEVSAIHFEIADRRETVMLLHGSLDMATSWMQAFLLNEQLEVVKKGERVKIDLDVNAPENRLKYLGRHMDDANGYVWWQFSNTFGNYVRGIKIDFQTLRVSTTGSLESNLQGEWWGGLSCKGKFYLLGKEKKRKGADLLNMYAFDASTGKFLERSAPVPEKSVFDDKQFSAGVAAPGRYISRKNQFFHHEGAIYCLSETERGLLNLTQIDPEAMKTKEWAMTNPPEYKKAKARSLMAEGKIFRMLYTPVRFQLSIHALSDSSLLFSDSVTIDKPDFKLFNAPVTYVGPKPGFVVWKVKNDTTEVKSVSQFLEELNHSDDAYLYLGITENGYNIRVLTSKAIAFGGGSPSLINMKPGVPGVPGSATQVLLTNMYALLALNKDLSKMPPRATTDAFDFGSYSKDALGPWVFSEKLETYQDISFFTLFGKRFSGDWDNKTQTYTLKRTDF